MKKVVKGYTVYFKVWGGGREDPVHLTIEGGRSAIQQWAAKEPMLIIKGEAIPFSEVAKIGKRYAFNDRDAQRVLAEGKGIYEDEADRLLASGLGDNLPKLEAPPSEHGRALAAELPSL